MFIERKKVNMSDDLVKRLRLIGEKRLQCTACYKFIDTADEAADRIEKLERDVLKYSRAVADAQMRNEELDRALNRIIDRWEAQKARIEKLEAALREIAALGFWDGDSAMSIARKALEGKDD